MMEAMDLFECCADREWPEYGYDIRNITRRKGWGLE
jgi:hypothetical protein